LMCVWWITPGDEQRNCPKHWEFHFQNKIWGISASSWFCYKEICHDARSHERKICLQLSACRLISCSTYVYGVWSKLHPVLLAHTNRT
jgi:hypothetical protein